MDMGRLATNARMEEKRNATNARMEDEWKKEERPRMHELKTNY